MNSTSLTDLLNLDTLHYEHVTLYKLWYELFIANLLLTVVAKGILTGRVVLI